MDTIKEMLKQLLRQAVFADHQSLSDQLRESLIGNEVLNSTTSMVEQIEEERHSELRKLTEGYGLRSWVESHPASEQELRKQIEELISPVSSIQSALAGIAIPHNIVRTLDQFDISSRLIGEFAYSHEIEEEELTNEESELNVCDEVESRIIQVEYLPQRVFDAIRHTPELMRSMEPRAFEELTAELLRKLGFQCVQLTPRSGDGGRDIIATREVNNIPIIMAFECKKYSESRKIGPETLRALLGTVSHGRTKASMGVLVTTSSFTSGALSYIAAEASIDGKDFKALSKWLASVD